MLSAQTAIHRYQRDVAVGLLLRSALLAGFVFSALVLPFLVPGYELVGLVAVTAAWLMLSITSAKNSRILGPSPDLIASGQFEEAEQRIDEALRAFSLSRTSKLLGLHHLAALRHKQRRWQDSATLCRAVLSQRLAGAAEGLGRTSRLMLADALLELGDVRGAGEAIDGLRGEPMGLAELMTMLQVELDYFSRVNAWDRIWAGAPTKVQLAEVMPPEASARVQAILALAARKVGRTDWSDWLRRRVELLADVGKLTAERAALWELWKKD